MGRQKKQLKQRSPPRIDQVSLEGSLARPKTILHQHQIMHRRIDLVRPLKPQINQAVNLIILAIRLSPIIYHHLLEKRRQLQRNTHMCYRRGLPRFSGVERSLYPNLRRRCP
jgi:hypothetical protein